jgi:hypothetical protein
LESAAAILQNGGRFPKAPSEPKRWRYPSISRAAPPVAWGAAIDVPENEA